MFWDWRTLLSYYRRLNPATPKDYRPFYSQVQAGLLRQLAAEKQKDESYDGVREAVALAQASAEAQWHKLGKPYFKLFAGMTRAVADPDAVISSNAVIAPLPTFLLRLPERHGLAALSVNGAELRSILIEEVQPDAEIRVSDLTKRLSPDDEEYEGHRCVLWLDSGETGGEDSGLIMPAVAMQIIKGSGATDYDYALAEWTLGVPIPPDVAKTTVRLLLSTCAMSAAGDAVEYDVLNKWTERYRQSTDPGERSELERRSRKLGKYGWLVGRECETRPSRPEDETRLPNRGART